MAQDEGEVRFGCGEYEVTVATGYGPRILGLTRDGRPNPFARLADEVSLGGGPDGPFRMRGGHRLWAAPEVPSVTYASDDLECEVSQDGETITVRGGVDAAGLQKTLTIQPSDSSILVDHVLTNRSETTMTVAPWAITQLKLGGQAICPLEGPTGDGFQADRSLVLWPYTDLSDPRLDFGSRAITVEASPGPALKLGSGPAPGRLGYLMEGQLFQKTVAAADHDRAYPDRGAVSQVYVNEDFCELESVGALVALAPGEAAHHSETWSLGDCPYAETASRRVTGS